MYRANFTLKSMNGLLKFLKSKYCGIVALHLNSLKVTLNQWHDFQAGQSVCPTNGRHDECLGNM